MTEAQELIDQADLFLADAVDIVEGGRISKPDARQVDSLANVAATLYLAATVRLRQQGAEVQVLHAEPLPEGAWVDQLLREHDCHVLIAQRAGGAAGNQRALVRCQTCDTEIPLP